MIEQVFGCKFCGIERVLSFKNNKQLNQYLKYGMIDQCLICKLLERIDEHIESIFLNYYCTYYGKFLFTQSDFSEKLNEAIGFSYRMDRKAITNIYFQLNELNLSNSFLLLSSYIEASYNAINNTYINLNKKILDIDKFGEINQTYKSVLEISFTPYERTNFSDKTNQNNFFHNNHLQMPRYAKVTELIRVISNVIKHDNGKLNMESRSGKKLIDKYGFKQEFEDIYIQSGVPIKNINCKARLIDINILTIKFYIFLRDTIFIIFNCPKVKEKKIDFEKLQARVFNFRLNEKLLNIIKSELVREGLVK